MLTCLRLQVCLLTRLRTNVCLRGGECDDPASRLMSYRSVSPISTSYCFIYRFYVLSGWVPRVRKGFSKV